MKINLLKKHNLSPHLRALILLLTDMQIYSLRFCFIFCFNVSEFTLNLLLDLFLLRLFLSVFPFLSELTWLLATMAIYGVGTGANMGLFNLVFIQEAGLDNLAPVLGACYLLVALCFVSIGPLVGMYSVRVLGSTS